MKYLIRYDCGYGDMTEVIQVDTQEEADAAAYEAWKEEAETHAVYEAKPLTREDAENYGHEDELDDIEEQP